MNITIGPEESSWGTTILWSRRCVKVDGCIGRKITEDILRSAETSLLKVRDGMVRVARNFEVSKCGTEGTLTVEDYRNPWTT